MANKQMDRLMHGDRLASKQVELNEAKTVLRLMNSKARESFTFRCTKSISTINLISKLM
jgi:hypothetical protein